jgi:hypothetical protein
MVTSHLDEIERLKLEVSLLVSQKEKNHKTITNLNHIIKGGL